MQNLAGNANCDVLIRRELERARIEVQELSARLQAEVPASVIGKLGGYEFRRAWYYWVVTGPMPIGIAEELFVDPVGKTDIRVAGHCGCPPPKEPWVTWLLGGQIVLPLKEEVLFDNAIKGLDGPAFNFGEEKKKYIFSDDPVSLGARAYVMSYHIDSEIGLRLFADAIYKWNLDKV